MDKYSVILNNIKNEPWIYILSCPRVFDFLLRCANIYSIYGRHWKGNEFRHSFLFWGILWRVSALSQRAVIWLMHTRTDKDWTLILSFEILSRFYLFGDSIFWVWFYLWSVVLTPVDSYDLGICAWIWKWVRIQLCRATSNTKW